jgi:hypothetical protein
MKPAFIHFELSPRRHISGTTTINLNEFIPRQVVSEEVKRIIEILTGITFGTGKSIFFKKTRFMTSLGTFAGITDPFFRIIDHFITEDTFGYGFQTLGIHFVPKARSRLVNIFRSDALDDKLGHFGEKCVFGCLVC